jgi:hypothetical protein
MEGETIVGVAKLKPQKEDRAAREKSKKHK